MEAQEATGAGMARLLELNDGVMTGSALHAVVELGVADLLAEGPRAADDLAAALSVDPGALRRLLRLLVTYDLFTEPDPGTFALTAVGQHLREDHPASVRSLVRVTKLCAPVAIDVVHSVRTGSTAFDRVYGAPLFGYLQEHPEVGAVFNRAMSDYSRLESVAVLASYDFTDRGRIVDVGGGDGTFLSAILQAVPGTTGVVFDQPHVVDAARARLTAGALTDRCAVVGGDFFAEVPAGGDVYLLKSVLHDWPDDRAVEILRACRRAIDPDGRLLLLERVIPAGDEPHPAKLMDVIMLVVLGGRERTRDEYDALLTEAGFTLADVIDTPSPLSVIEAVPAPR